MTETTPEQPISAPPEQPISAPQISSGQQPRRRPRDRDADGVDKDSLTRWAVYETTTPGRGRYVATYTTKREATADERVKSDPDRYSVRHV